MSETVETVITLKQHQLDYLRRIAETHGLPDESKALRCLVEFAIEESEREHDLFGVIRCRGC